ncbi:MAG: BatA domain-containing protein [Pirellulales bacterium]
MNFLPQFTSVGFAIAGLACAAGPIVIHLLNRRRFRTVNWAAMEFLLEAVQRNRKIMQLRDILLLILRTAAVLFFGLALARPFMALGTHQYDATQPLHAIVIIDNSLSMGLESLEGTLLDKAIEKSLDFIDQLPPGSRTTVIPLCDSAAPIAEDAYRTKEDAKEAIQNIEIVSRSSSIRIAGNLATVAAERLPQLAPRVVMFTDQQSGNWNDLLNASQAESLPEMQLIEVGDANTTNTWVSDFKIQDALADVDTPTNFVVRIQHQGEQPRDELQVLFKVAGNEVDSKTVRLEAGSSIKEVSFRYTFDIATVEPGKPAFVPVEVSIAPDRLHLDDSRSLIVPVVAALPVLFIDERSDSEEDPRKNRFGATWSLRRLLAPITDRSETDRQLIQVRHVKYSDLSPQEFKEALRGTRLTVIAGIEKPPEYFVPLLREYMQQGGQLFIAAGNQFDPIAWTEIAWKDGSGILPLPLHNSPIGHSIDSLTEELKPFRLSYSSMQDHALFQLADQSDSQLLDLYSEALFFKAVVPVTDSKTFEILEKTERTRLEKQAGIAAELLQQQRKVQAAKTISAAEEDAIEHLQSQLQELQPQWLLWKSEKSRTTAISEIADSSSTESADSDTNNDNEKDLEQAKVIDKQVEASRPRVLAQFDNQVGFVVERNLEKGRVIFVSSSLDNRWTTLPGTNAILMFDRILRSMLESTIPQRTFEEIEQLTIPIATTTPATYVELWRPGQDTPEVLPIGFIDEDTKGITINDLLVSGQYSLHIKEQASGIDSQSSTNAENDRQIPLVIQSPSAESQLTKLSEEDFNERKLGTQLRWVSSDQEISLSGTQIQGQNWWKYLIAALLVCLLAELLFLAQPGLLTPFQTKTKEITTAD